MARVVIERLSKRFRGSHGEEIRAVEDLNLSVHDCELLVLAGPSGSGKTTLLRLLAGLETPDHGTIALDGTIINEFPPERREMAMVFQNAALYPHMTVRENLAFGLRIRRLARAEIHKRLETAAEILGLVTCLDRLPMQISGGERQRVALGRALVRQPRIFLLDEPLSNLDPQTRLELRAQIAALHERLGATTIYVTHDQAEAMALGHRIALLHKGKIEQVAAPCEIYNEPANMFVAGFFGSAPMNLLQGTLQRGGGKVWIEGESRVPAPVRVGLGESLRLGAAIPSGKAVVLGIRPEDITLLPESAAGREGALSGRVEHVEFSGPDTFVYLAVGGRKLIARAHSRSMPVVGTVVHVEIAQERGHLFDPETGKSLAGSDGHDSAVATVLA